MGIISAAAAVILAAASGAGAQEMSGVPADACRDYASIAYNCCVYVRGYRDEASCRATHLSRGQDRARSAVQNVVKQIVKRIATGGTALSRMTAVSLIPQLVTDRLDLTGQESLASGQVAACSQGYSVAPGPGVSRVGASGYSNPLYGFGRWDQARVQAYIEQQRDACRRQTVEAAIREVQRPRASGEWCGRTVTDQPPMQRTGYRPPAMTFVQPAHYCSSGAPNCCPGRGFYSGSAYCNAGTPSPLCLPNRAP